MTTAAKRGEIGLRALQPAIDSMRLLNKVASEAASDIRVHGCTDITGNGLAGHLLEMVGNTGLDARIELRAIPVFEGVYELAGAGFAPGGSKSNRAYLGNSLDLGQATEAQSLVFLDPQTSGGLLLAIHPDDAGRYCERMASLGQLAVDVGCLQPGENRVLLV